MSIIYRLSLIFVSLYEYVWRYVYTNLKYLRRCVMLLSIKIKIV